MKKIITLLLVLVSFNISAQNKYEKGMTKAFDLWDQGKTKEAAQLFERIGTAEKENWLPPFYVATIEITTSFGLKDEKTLDAKLKKAQRFLDKASDLSKDNPEIIITQALLNTAYLAFDAQKYGMTIPAKNAALYEKALQLAPNNPRVLLSKAEWDMGGAKFFGQPIDPYCKDVVKALSLFPDEKPKNFLPSWGKERAKEVLKKCPKS